MVAFSRDDIAFGESLVRVSAHLDNALGAYEAGAAERALLHASRPMVELLPRISRELWRDDELGRSLNHAAAAVASEIRQHRPPTEVRRARDGYDDLSARAVGAIVGEAASEPAYRASIVVALLRTAVSAYDEAVRRDEARARLMYEDAAALIGRARALAAMLWGGAISNEAIESAFAEIGEPPARDGDEARAARVREVAGTIAQILHTELGALLDQDPRPADHLAAATRLLTDGLEAYRAGEMFRADKLVARAYVEELAEAAAGLPNADQAVAEALDDVLGARIRRAIAARAPEEAISSLVDQAVDLLARFGL